MFSASIFVFFFNATATTEIYTLSLHDALPISYVAVQTAPGVFTTRALTETSGRHHFPFTDGEIAVYVSDRSGENDVYYQDRKSTRLNSSHPSISYAVFCLKKKKKKYQILNSYT